MLQGPPCICQPDKFAVSGKQREARADGCGVLKTRVLSGPKALLFAVFQSCRKAELQGYRLEVMSEQTGCKAPYLEHDTISADTQSSAPQTSAPLFFDVFRLCMLG